MIAAIRASDSLSCESARSKDDCLLSRSAVAVEISKVSRLHSWLRVSSFPESSSIRAVISMSDDDD